MVNKGVSNMKNLFTKIAALFLSIGMVLGVGFAVSRNSKAVQVNAAESTHTFTDVAFSKLLNNNATIASVSVPEQSYSVSKIVANVRYNKTAGGVTITPTIGTTVLESQTHNANSTVDLTWNVSPAVQGAINFDFVNNCGSGTGKGTFYFNSVTLTEEGGTVEPSTLEHAGTEADPYTTADAKIVMDNTGSGVVHQTEIYVSMVPTSSSFNSSYNQYTCTDSNIEISSASLGFTPKGTYTETDALVGKTIVAKGYIELYNGVYKMGYLPASVSPTGSKYNPSIVSITPDEGSGEQSEEVYTLTPASGSNNSYAGNCDIAIDGITWNLTGNSQMHPWRIGGKSLDAVDRELYSKTAISEEVSKIEVTHGAASGITVNSWTVIVASDAEFEKIISTLTPEFVASDTTTISRPSDVSWKNAYYKFIYNVTVTVTSNKFLEFTQATFYYEQESAGVAAWCASFLSTVTCDATGATPPSTSAWSTMKTSFNDLSSDDKLALKTVSNEATARYDYIIAKYGTTNYENFIGRTITPLGSSKVLFNTLTENNAIIPLIVIISLIAVSGIGAYIFIKKKEN